MTDLPRAACVSALRRVLALVQLRPWATASSPSARTPHDFLRTNSAGDGDMARQEIGTAFEGSRRRCLRGTAAARRMRQAGRLDEPGAVFRCPRV